MPIPQEYRILVLSNVGQMSIDLWNPSIYKSRKKGAGMHNITFCSFKGGTAKTSTTLHLGACLAKYHNKRVLLIDCDSQANLSSGLGFGPDNLEALPAVLKGERTISNIIKKTCIDGLDIVLANVYLDGIESTHPLTSDLYSHERLRKSLKDLDYDYCFIDTPPSLGWLTQSAFYASQSTVICLTPEPYSLLGLQRLKEYHDAIKENHSLDVMGVLLTFWDPRGATNDVYLETIEASFPAKTFETKIRRDMAVNRAILKEKPVIEVEPTSRASEDFHAFAIEFLNKTTNNQSIAKSVERMIESVSKMEASK
jgi:chromosome partitioning protein